MTDYKSHPDEITALMRADAYQEGAIIASSWGYDETTVDFYQIVKRTGDWLTLHAMSSTETSDGEQTMTGHVLPGELRASAKPFRRKLLRYKQPPRAGEIAGLQIRSDGWASIWEGRPMAVSHYG